MPVIRHDRLPLPNLKTYTFFSVLALSACVYIANNMVNEDGHTAGELFASDEESLPSALASLVMPAAAMTNDRKPAEEATPADPKTVDAYESNGTAEERTLKQWFSDISAVMIREPFCVWVLINMEVCGLILLGTCIQQLVFGRLRVSEQQHLKDNFWNFIFYKFIFIFGVINVQYLDEVLLWCSWFATLGFLQLTSHLTKDRFEYLTFSPATPIWNHCKLIGLLVSIFAMSSFMLLLSVFIGFFQGFNTFAFMAPEALLLSIRTMYTILNYGYHLYDLRHDSTPTNMSEPARIWEKRGPVVYYIELSFELTALIIELIHHLHMLLWSNILLSMASLVICMQIRFLFQEIQRRIKKHRNYLWLHNHLEQNYPMALPEEISKNSDNCAICWEKMESARKLPCKHLFHNTCLQSWLEQDTSCPICRLALNIHTSRTNQTEIQNDNPQPARRDNNHFFHFDGSRYVSWLPSFFVEVRPAQLVRTDDQNSQFDAMARQVQQLFSHIPISVIIDDLRVTRSVELTIENVLEGRLVTPTIYREPDSSTSTISSNARSQLPPSVPSTSRSSSPASSDWESTPENTEPEDTTAAKFSMCREERERMLQKRKDHLLYSARRSYMERKIKDGQTSES